MNTLNIDGLVIEKSEFMGVAEARIEVSKHLALHSRIEEMSMYWDEENETFKLITGIERAELFLSKEVAEKIAEFLKIPKWAYDNYDNVVTLKDGEWIYTEI
ncbi:hypothetical protein [Shewanella sp. GD04112]|uniref:hypothetical protein n=1 Tax=Shewanella sp. GD04112 TaxID=2975434 RepID=UPI00244D11CF|nr:hypothetical protein [Shewanella sp. GD04112]MDH0448716.1 hypothetical protein [Shewanella sp. GD04112]MDH0448727.1 hypothetical protein [Shewanella sp. GD04112]